MRHELVEEAVLVGLRALWGLLMGHVQAQQAALQASFLDGPLMAGLKRGLQDAMDRSRGLVREWGVELKWGSYKVRTRGNWGRAGCRLAGRQERLVCVGGPTGLHIGAACARASSTGVGLGVAQTLACMPRLSRGLPPDRNGLATMGISFRDCNGSAPYSCGC